MVWGTGSLCMEASSKATGARHTGPTGPRLSGGNRVGLAYLQPSLHPQAPKSPCRSPRQYAEAVVEWRESFRNGRDKGTVWGSYGGEVTERICHPLLTNALAVSSLVLAPGYCYILEIFAHSLDQSTFMEHMLFVENLFVNSTVLTTNLFIKYLLLFINFLIHSLVLSNALTSQHILNTWFSYSDNQLATKYLLFDHPSIYPFVQSINKPTHIYWILNPIFPCNL